MRLTLRVRRRQAPLLIAGIVSIGSCGAACGAEPSPPEEPAAADVTSRVPPHFAPTAAAATTASPDTAPEPFPWGPIDRIREELSAAVAQDVDEDYGFDAGGLWLPLLIIAIVVAATIAFFIVRRRRQPTS